MGRGFDEGIGACLQALVNVIYRPQFWLDLEGGVAYLAEEASPESRLSGDNPAPLCRLARSTSQTAPARLPGFSRADREGDYGSRTGNRK